VGAIAIVVGLVLAVTALVAVSGGLLVLLAYGVGLVVSLALPFEPFQATLLSLIGIVATGWVIGRVLFSYVASQDPVAGGDYDQDYEEDEEDEEEYEVRPHFPSMPQLRPTLKHVDFSTAQPDDRCPCGSGRKYKNCHGAKHRAMR
jgi:hypothetical protein